MGTDIPALETAKGQIRIVVNPDPEHLSSLSFGEGFAGAQQQYIAREKQRFLELSSKNQDRVVLAVTDADRIIIAFSILGPPEAEKRWAMLGKRRIMELKDVEVARDFRNLRLATYLLTHLFSVSGIEDKLIYLTAYSWTWDHDHLNMSVERYRHMLIKLYERFGFCVNRTNEPNVCLRPENLFMVRTGKNVDADTLEAFKWIRFGISLHGGEETVSA